MSDATPPPPLPFAGSWRVRLHGIRPFSIHGDSYFELAVERPEDPGRMLGLRTSSHTLAPGVVAGSDIEVSFLMGQVTGVKPA